MKSTPFFVPSCILTIALCGCGGNRASDSSPSPIRSTDQYVTVPTGNQDLPTSTLDSIEILPIDPTQQVFSTRWSPDSGNGPPSQFDLQLLRFSDADEKSAEVVPISLKPTAYEAPQDPPFGQISYGLQLKGSDFSTATPNAPLFVAGGVYISDLRTPPGVTPSSSRRQAFIIPRGVPHSDDLANTVTVQTKNPGNSGSIDFLQVTPARGSVFVPRDSEVALYYSPQQGTPPRNWTVTLRRYKDTRSGRPFSETGQPITVQEIAPNRWRVHRAENLALDAYATYVIEIRGVGRDASDGEQNIARHVFITDRE